MKICLRILAVITFFLSMVGLFLCFAVGVGVWIVERPARVKAERLFGRMETALNVADQNLDQVKASLARATERLDQVRQEQRTLAQEPRRADVGRRFLARTVQQRIAPELTDAHDKLHTVAEAATVVNSMLEDIGNFPLLSVSGLDMDGLTAMNNRLGEVGPAAWELSRLLGASEPEATADTGQEFSRIERILGGLRTMIAEFEGRLAEVRQSKKSLESKTLPWITPAAIAISVVCSWIAFSQISVMGHARSWWRHQKTQNP